MTYLEPPEDKELALKEHLIELRRRLIIVIISIAALVCITFPFSKQLLEYIVKDVVPQGTEIIVLGPMEYLYILVLISLTLSIILSFPVIIYETFMFMKPGLFPSERKFFLRIVPTSFILFIIGALFSYKLLLPLSLDFLLDYTVGKAEAMLVLSRFVRFLSFLLLSVGLIFQIPLIIALAVKADLIQKEDLKKKRKYIYGVLLLIAFFIAPDPTPITPLLILLTLALVYEISIFFANYLL